MKKEKQKITTPESNPKKDTQAFAYTMCCNNPLKKGYTHGKLRELLMEIPKIDYWALCDEIGGEEKTPHTHIYDAAPRKSVRPDIAQSEPGQKFYQTISLLL